MGVCLCVSMRVCTGPCVYSKWFYQPSPSSVTNSLPPTGHWGLQAEWEINNINWMSIGDGQVVLTAHCHPAFFFFVKQFVQHSFCKLQFPGGERQAAKRQRQKERDQKKKKKASPQPIKLGTHCWYIFSSTATVGWRLSRWELFFLHHQSLNRAVVVISSLLSIPHNLPFIKEMGFHQLVFLYNIACHYFPCRYRACSYIALIIELYLSYDIKKENKHPFLPNCCKFKIKCILFDPRGCSLTTWGRNSPSKQSHIWDNFNLIKSPHPFSS